MLSLGAAGDPYVPVTSEWQQTQKALVHRKLSGFDMDDAGVKKRAIDLWLDYGVCAKIRYSGRHETSVYGINCKENWYDTPKKLLTHLEEVSSMCDCVCHIGTAD